MLNDKSLWRMQPEFHLLQSDFHKLVEDFFSEEHLFQDVTEALQLLSR